MLRLLALVVGFAGSSGCARLDKHKSKHVPQLGVIDSHQPRELQMISLPLHVVEPPDELEVQIKPDTVRLDTQSLIVRTDGHIDLGFEGDVYVAGLTLDQVELRIAQQLTARHPDRAPFDVSVRLINGERSRSYYVLGAVTTQGRFPLTGRETVLDGILQAGLRSNSYPEKAYLSRPHPNGGPDTILAIDWFGIKDRGDTTTNYQLLPGDRIVVPGGKPPGLIQSLLSG
jgi:polysaccharide export outer membrane protein